MKLPLIHNLCILILMTSCHGQPPTPTTKSEAPSVPTATGDTTKALSNNIMVIHQDRKNNYWFGSWQEGLYKYDGKSIVHFTTKDGLPDNRVEEIKEDAEGNIYVNTRQGLCRYNGNGFLKLTPTMRFNGQWTSHPVDLWFKSLDYSGYIYRWDGKNLHLLEFPKSQLGEDYIQKHPNYPNPYAVYCIYKDSRQNIWFGTSTLGVCRFDGESFDWISEQDVTEIHDGPANGVRSIAEDSNGDFWFNTACRYTVYGHPSSENIHPEASTFYQRTKSIGCLDGKKDGDLNEYLSIIKDDDDNLWMATYLNGVWKYDGKKIHHYLIQVNDANIPVYCLYKDNNGDIWLGTHENGAFMFNGQSFDKFTP
ncbi:MAG: hypothetical protein J5I41_09080 [Saprospiraceae bacterium]|nr:hypothetical protein [Saprospiraceae bacterium]